MDFEQRASGERGEHELEHTLIAAFRKAAASINPEDPLSEGQQQLIVQFRALRNGLGNYGRHGETLDHVLLPSPLLERNDHQPTDEGPYILEFIDPIPQGTAWVLLNHPQTAHHAPSISKYPADRVREHKYLWIDRRDVSTVELADFHHVVQYICVPTDLTRQPSTRAPARRRSTIPKSTSRRLKDGE
ncbi:hypothetical protein [Nocardia sp. NPDC004711]